MQNNNFSNFILTLIEQEHLINLFFYDLKYMCLLKRNFSLLYFSNSLLIKGYLAYNISIKRIYIQIDLLMMLFNK
ncbi:hypothetical protein pb186bvf_004073 [Paramecium bursaria]